MTLFFKSFQNQNRLILTKLEEFQACYKNMFQVIKIYACVCVCVCVMNGNFCESCGYTGKGTECYSKLQFWVFEKKKMP